MKGQIFSLQQDPFEQEYWHGSALHTNLTASSGSCAITAWISTIALISDYCLWLEEYIEDSGSGNWETMQSSNQG